MSHFKFNDVSKLLPFTESACPESQCYDSLQILVKMSMHQETEYKKSNKTWFQLDVPETMSISDVGSLKSVIFRNDSLATGDLYLEGNIK